MLLGTMMVILAIGFTACEGDQGEIGPKGDAGAQGEKGTQGEQGIPGEKGNTEGTSFGNIELTVSGVDMRDEAFTEVIDFKYLPYNDPSHSIWYNDGNDNMTFSILREYKVAAKTNGRTQDMGNVVKLEFSKVGDDLVLDNFSYSTSIIVNNSLIYVYDYVSGMEDDAENFIISGFSYNETTGALKFNFTYSYDDGEEQREFSGKVDVIVYEAHLG